MNAEKTAIMLAEMAGGIILGFVIWSFVAPSLSAGGSQA